MNKEIKDIIKSLNFYFDKTHYISKNKRNIKSLYKTLLYNSDRYKENINLIQKMYSNKLKKKIKINHRELVACSIAAKSHKSGTFGTSFEVLDKKKYHKTLIRELNKLGTIGKESLITNCTNIIGKCAEIKATNNLLKNDKKTLINSIEFSTAIRPRTSEPIPRCKNCIYIFGNE